MEHNNYFEFRQVSPNDYLGFTLPTYIGNVILKVTEPRVLDFGCGFGQMLHALKMAGVKGAEGLDIEPEAIEYCRSQGLRCIDGMSETDFYRERSGYYDFVLMSHVLEHFPKDQVVAQLEKIKRLLKPSGSLIVMVPNAQSTTGAYWAYEDFTHHLLFTSGSLYYVLRAAGYREIEFIDIDCTEDLSPLNRFFKKTLLGLYKLNYLFWNRVTSSAVHQPSPLIFSYEIKALART